MPATIKQFEGSMVSPKDDAIMHELFNEQNGVIRGCAITYLGTNQIRVGAGYIYICGRTVYVEEETVISPFATEVGTEGELVLKIDMLSDVPAQLVARVPRQELVQEDINGDGTEFEYLLATYTINDVTISGLTIAYEVVTSGVSEDKILKTLAEVGLVTKYGFLVDAMAFKELSSKIQNFELTKGYVVSSALGQKLGLTEENTWQEIWSTITNAYNPSVYQSGSLNYQLYNNVTSQIRVNFPRAFIGTPQVSVSTPHPYYEVQNVWVVETNPTYFIFQARGNLDIYASFSWSASGAGYAV